MAKTCTVPLNAIREHRSLPAVNNISFKRGSIIAPIVNYSQSCVLSHGFKDLTIVINIPDVLIGKKAQ
jgi:hypothetical protein